METIVTHKSSFGPCETNDNCELENNAQERLWYRNTKNDVSVTRDRRRSTEGYKGLVVWQRAIEMVDAVYGLTRGFPQIERFALSDQMRRAAVSVPSNIAEGYGRNSRGEFRQFLGVARGSNSELETQIIIAKRQRFGAIDALSQAENLNREVGRLLNGYMKAVGNEDI
jgi:four helix bundle protein